MKTSQFIKELIYKGITITNYPKHFGNWDNVANVKYITRYVNYKCGKPLKCVTKLRPRCCCNECAYNVGYLRDVPARHDVLGIYASLFKKDTGFWSKTGCRLPRLLRSITCLTYRCNLTHQVSAIDSLILHILRYGINHKEVRQRIKKFAPNSFVKSSDCKPYIDLRDFINGYLETHNRRPLGYDLFSNFIKRTIRQLGSNYNTHFQSVLHPY